VIVQAPPSGAERALAILLLAAVWTCYLSLGLKYAAVSAAMLLSLAMSARGRLANPAWRSPPFLATCWLLLWLAASASWSPAPWSVKVSHFGHYASLLLVPVIASACRPQLARRALQHFVIASVFVAALFALDRQGWLPASPAAWHTTVGAEGNQRIATSILLALGSCLGLWLALQARSWKRALWLAGAALCVSAVAWQDRRSGMVVLPVVLLSWAITRHAGWRKRVGMLALIAAAGALAWQTADGVRARFAEGVAEVLHFTADDNVATSWGQRLRLWQLTEAMVEERPLVGHGIASWQEMWRSRVAPGSAVSIHTTPHNAYLLLAQQGGLVALLLWLWLLLAWLRQAMHAGAAGVPAVMLWTAISCVGLFNAVLRDAKFALPLLLLAALAAAAARTEGPGSPPR
jgi:O-antigen ligase